MRYEVSQEWDLATALIARATPQYQQETTLLVRLSYHEVLSP